MDLKNFLQLKNSTNFRRKTKFTLKKRPHIPHYSWISLFLYKKSTAKTS